MTGQVRALLNIQCKVIEVLSPSLGQDSGGESETQAGPSVKGQHAGH